MNDKCVKCSRQISPDVSFIKVNGDWICENCLTQKEASTIDFDTREFIENICPGVTYKNA